MVTRWKFLVAAGVAAALAGGPAMAQTSPKSVWDGVYSEGQAARGRGLYNARCAECHREDLSGGSDTGGGGSRALIGPRFWQDWGDGSLDELFGRMSSAMPASAPGSLGEQAYVDILAYLLQRNEFPAAEQELTRAAIPPIRVVSRDGRPQPLLFGTIVSVVGCLRGATGKWTLVNAGDPVKTRDPYPKGPVASAEAGALGSQVFELTDVFPEPSTHVGHRMEARGFLVRGQGDIRGVNVTALRVVSESCDQ